MFSIVFLAQLYPHGSPHFSTVHLQNAQGLQGCNGRLQFVPRQRWSLVVTTVTVTGHLPSGYVNSVLLTMAIEVVSFPTAWWIVPYFVVNVYYGR